MITLADFEAGVHKAAVWLANLLMGAETTVHKLEASDPMIATAVQLAEKEVPGIAAAEGVAAATLTLAQTVAAETQTAAAALAPAPTATPVAATASAIGLLIAGGLMLALSACSTLPAAFKDVADLAGAVSSATSGTVSTIASAVSTDATAAADATPDVQTLVSTIQGIVAEGTVTPADQATVTSALSDLTKIASTVTPASTGTQVSTALGGIEGVVSKLAPIFTDLAPLLAVVENDHRQGDLQFALLAETVAPAKVQHSDPAKVAALVQRMKHAKAIAAAKIAAGK